MAPCPQAGGGVLLFDSRNLPASDEGPLSASGKSCTQTHLALLVGLKNIYIDYYFEEKTLTLDK